MVAHTSVRHFQRSLFFFFGLLLFHFLYSSKVGKYFNTIIPGHCHQLVSGEVFQTMRMYRDSEHALKSFVIFASMVDLTNLACSLKLILLYM